MLAFMQAASSPAPPSEILYAVVSNAHFSRPFKCMYGLLVEPQCRLVPVAPKTKICQTQINLQGVSQSGCASIADAVHAKVENCNSRIYPDDVC
jgi:hypothetical protein